LAALLDAEGFMTGAAHNAIALLIEMAERGEIDPWDVEVITVVDRFLEELQQRQSRTPLTAFSRSRYEADLAESGQAFLYASMLVLFKADALAQTELSPLGDAAAEFEVDLLEDLTTGPSLPQQLERQLRRRAIAIPPQRRRVTLTDLIEQLEQMAQVLEQSPQRVRRPKPKPQPRQQALRAIAQLAHQENLAETATSLGEFLRQHWLRLSRGETWLNFEDLVQAWSARPQDRLTTDRLGIFWALLFLSAQSQVELQQDSLYCPLHLRCLAVGDTEIVMAADSPVPPEEVC
jgi:segregation and condensation protein A